MDVSTEGDQERRLRRISGSRRVWQHHSRVNWLGYRTENTKERLGTKLLSGVNSENQAAERQVSRNGSSKS